MPVDAFISYAREDEQHVETLSKHLSLLRRQGRIRAWTDHEINAGDSLRREIDDALERAELVLLLVSPDFVACDDCWDVELRRALERRTAGVRVVPIIVRPTDWQSSALGELQALPRNGEPIITWPHRDEAWLEVVQGLRRILDERDPGTVQDRPAPPGEDHRHRDGSVLVYVPAATYPLGSADLDEVSSPSRRVDLDGFWIGKHPVTNAQYRAFLEAAPGPEPRYWSAPRFAGPDQPVVGITWQEADAYCRHAGLVLPAESWWEAAARGPEGRLYPWGDTDPTSERAIFAGASGSPAAPAPIGARPSGASPFGAHDLAGNVREWCVEPWGKQPGRAGTGNFRVVRGGAWNDPAWKLRAAWRTWSAAGDRSPAVGFRVAAQQLGKDPPHLDARQRRVR